MGKALNNVIFSVANAVRGAKEGILKEASGKFADKCENDDYVTREEFEVLREELLELRKQLNAKK